MPTIVNFAPSPTRIPLDAHATAGYKQESLLEYLSGISASTKGLKLGLRDFA